MKVKIKTIMAGPGGNYLPGDEADLPDEVAHSLISGGFAESMEEPAEKEPGPVKQEEPDSAPEVVPSKKNKKS